MVIYQVVKAINGLIVDSHMTWQSPLFQMLSPKINSMITQNFKKIHKKCTHSHGCKYLYICKQVVFFYINVESLDVPEGLLTLTVHNDI